MKYVALVFGALALLVVFAASALGLGYLSFSNEANGFEADITSTYSNNQNVYDNGYKKVLEIAQVTELQAAGLKEVYDNAMKGRYGADGSRAEFQAIKEQNPNLDQSTYKKIQETIEIFRDTFESNQTKLISQKNAYQKFLTATTSGRVFNFIGKYPHIDMSKFDIVTSNRTQGAFDTKRDEPLQIAPKK